jgi:thiamine-phosphate pyrophosphorylase
MKLCYVTDRKTLAGPAEGQARGLLRTIARVSESGVDWIQIREKDLCGGELARLAGEARRSAPGDLRILLNDRLDVALAAGADGVHLGEQSLPAKEAKRLATERKGADRFMVGVSAHSLGSVVEAQANGADYVLFGPVFPTPSKLVYGRPQGVERLAAACQAVSIPVLAIGGITVENARECLLAGAAGIAAIRLFQEAGDVAAVVRALRGT